MFYHWVDLWINKKRRRRKEIIAMNCMKKLICLKIELKDKSWACASAYTYWKNDREEKMKEGKCMWKKEKRERLELQQAKLKIEYVVVDKNDRYLWVRRVRARTGARTKIVIFVTSLFTPPINPLRRFIKIVFVGFASFCFVLHLGFYYVCWVGRLLFCFVLFFSSFSLTTFLFSSSFYFVFSMCPCQ